MIFDFGQSANMSDNDVVAVASFLFGNIMLRVGTRIAHNVDSVV